MVYEVHNSYLYLTNEQDYELRQRFAHTPAAFIPGTSYYEKISSCIVNYLGSLPIDEIKIYRDIDFVGEEAWQNFDYIMAAAAAVQDHFFVYKNYELDEMYDKASDLDYTIWIKEYIKKRTINNLFMKKEIIYTGHVYEINSRIVKRIYGSLEDITIETGYYDINISTKQILFKFKK